MRKYDCTQGCPGLSRLFACLYTLLIVVPPPFVVSIRPAPFCQFLSPFSFFLSLLFSSFHFFPFAHLTQLPLRLCIFLYASCLQLLFCFESSSFFRLFVYQFIFRFAGVLGSLALIFTFVFGAYLCSTYTPR